MCIRDRKLIEQVRLANQQRFGRHTETMASIEGQLSFFDEAEALYNPLVQEPDPDEILPEKAKKKKSRGQREADLKDFPEDVIPAVSYTHLQQVPAHLLWQS